MRRFYDITKWQCCMHFEIIIHKYVKPFNKSCDVIHWPPTWFNIWKIFPNPRSSWAVANNDEDALPESISEVTFWREKLSDKNLPSSDIFTKFGGHKNDIRKNYIAILKTVSAGTWKLKLDIFLHHLFNRTLL